MFANAILTTAFTSPKAELYFKNKIIEINDPFYGDKTFISSLRAFLYNKMPDGEVLEFGVYRASSDEDIKYFVSNASNAMNKLYVVDGRHTDKFVSKEEIKAYAESLGWEVFTRVEALFVKEFDSMCFMNRENKTTVLCIPQMTIKKWHLIQCCILGVLPWYFNPENGLDEDDRELMYSFKKGTDDDYLKILNRIASKIDFKTEYIRHALVGFELTHEKQQYEQKQNEIYSYEGRIRDLQAEIENYMVSIEKCNLYLMGLHEKMTNNQGDSEIMRYFLNNTSLDLVKVNGTKLEYICKGCLTYWDANEAEKYIDNKNSRFYVRDSYDNSNYNNAPPFEDARLLFKAIFIDRLLKLRFCAAFRMDTSRYNCEGITGFPYGGEYDGYMANPHIDYHSCTGTYRAMFQNYLEQHDYIGCIESTIASALSLTVSDFTVLGEFMQILWSNKGFDRSTTNSTKCIELPNGVCVHAKDAIAWLKEEGYEQNN